MGRENPEVRKMFLLGDLLKMTTGYPRGHAEQKLDT